MTFVELEKRSFENPIILYDGFCFLCDRTINYLIEKDQQQKLRYHTLGEENNKPSTVKLLYQGKEYTQSDVMVMVSILIDKPGISLSLLKFIPKFLRDFGYKIIAANRYKILGRSDTCLIPTADKKHLFLHLTEKKRK